MTDREQEVEHAENPHRCGFFCCNTYTITSKGVGMTTVTLHRGLVVEVRYEAFPLRLRRDEGADR